MYLDNEDGVEEGDETKEDAKEGEETNNSLATNTNNPGVSTFLALQLYARGGDIGGERIHRGVQQ